MRTDQFRSGPIAVTAFDWVPDFAQGYVRDLRVRWALEEAGFPYRAEIVRQGEQRKPANLARQPFGQVPVLTVGGHSMFESGACVWRVAEASDALLPADEAERDLCFSWVFGALDSVEEPINLVAFLRIFAEDKAAAARIEPQAKAMLAERLGRLADALGDREHLVGGRFTVADLLMTFVLRNVEPEGDLDAFPVLKRYVGAHSARPAFRRALEAQLVPFRENAARYEGASEAAADPS